ncbi:L,D-transpeptidase catalytic domain [Cognatiyoonia koreensis]|uniref:L,D-transpeptidase catalytic domain n=1 Tax=Cognatiyoonia koreensis TaxID=364200 RepID=A0A1I0QNS7_9RHOB|nr:L,D-transpeptidase family protein [Cognatiyoonia koreensis]SEW28932.1 L,D-transpeptidase catalytic domain [Cognatiyoonia koreensis]
MKRILFGLFALTLATVAYTQIMLRTGSGTPPTMAATTEQADAIHVDKSDRKLTLLKAGEPIFQTKIALGRAPEGHKRQEGDERTPTGSYTIDWRNENSIAHLSLHISYPNEDDRAQATDRNVSPGGNIMIHGVLNGWGALGPLQHLVDWTNGCIAVTNADMQTIWSLVPNGTPITIEE